eukprot:1368643-Amorphochlora_amoeboformis.AAC.1
MLSVLLLAGLAAADISFSRSNEYLEPDATITLTVDTGCTVKDQYGSNNCDWHWGSRYTISANFKLAEVQNQKDDVAPFSTHGALA